jgi:hypothetical protein
VKSIRHGDRQIVLPPVEARPIGSAVREALVGIASGRAPDRHGWLDRVAPAPVV